MIITTEQGTFTIQKPLPPKWKISIPRDGHFQYSTPDDLTIWQRFWLRFIGWGVKPYE